MTSSPTSSEPTRLDANIREVTAVCETHGEYPAREFTMPLIGKSITSPCPTCSAETRARNEQADRERAERELAFKVAGLFHRSGIPARFADRTLSSYRAEGTGQARALKIASRYVESFGESRGASMVFAGKPGTGKTHIACGIARALIEQSKSALFMTVLQALRHIKDTYRRDSDKSETDAIADLLRPDLLILDEVGAQLGSEHEKMLMFEVINERYQQCRSTILISNLNADELTEFLGDRVMDRFREAGAVVAFDWQSHRGRRDAA
jgi:DNA replication protein DnaC